MVPTLRIVHRGGPKKCRRCLLLLVLVMFFWRQCFTDLNEFLQGLILHYFYLCRGYFNKIES